MFSRTVATTARRAVASTAPRLAARQAVRPAAVAPVQRRAYHEKVIDHYSRPRNVGSMVKTDVDVGTGLVGAPACGDVMKLQIRVDPETNTISDVKFKTFGCGSAIASSSYLTELVRGMSLEEAGKIKNTEIAQELCLPPVKRMFLSTAAARLPFPYVFPSLTDSPPSSVHCSMLAEDAIKSAISNYYTKNPKAQKTNLAGTAAKMPTAGEAATA